MISTLAGPSKKRKLDLESEEEEKQQSKKQKLIDGSFFLSVVAVSFPEPVMSSLKPPSNVTESKKQRNKKNRRFKQEQMFEQREARRLLDRDNRIYSQYTIFIPGRDAYPTTTTAAATIDFDSNCSSDHCTSSESESNNETEKNDGDECYDDDSLGTIWVLHPKFGKKVRRSARLRALQQY